MVRSGVDRVLARWRSARLTALQIHEMECDLHLAAGERPAHELLGALGRFGRFRFTSFRDVCVGLVQDQGALLEGIDEARAGKKAWAQRIARLVPVETVIPVTADGLVECLKEAVVPFAGRMPSGASFCVRFQRRGLPEGSPSSEAVEQALGTHLLARASAEGHALTADFERPDFLVAIEDVGAECGVALLPRTIRERFPFVHARPH